MRGCFLLLALGVAGVGCGDSDSPSPEDNSADAATDLDTDAGVTGAGSGGGAGSDAPVPMGKPTDNPVEGLAISPECQGIDFEGIVYSPGGTTLPNICEPYHRTLNNPFAVRCIDAWPWYETDFPGDEYCILPPPPDKGMQFGMHPQGDADAWFAQVSKGDMSGYEDLTDPWTLPPGAEEEVNYYGGANNAEPFNFYRNNVRMRAGSHHMINSIAPTPGRDTWGAGSAAGLFQSFIAGGGLLPGAQRPDENTPETIDKPEEDAGLYSIFPANADITFNIHHFNSTPETILREVWINLWFEDDATVESVGLVGLNVLHPVLLNVTPNTTQDLHYSFAPTQPIRVIRLFGHRHAWTPNFTAWVERPGEELEIVYQSFDWFDQPTYRYDSITQNPAPDPDARADGGHTGMLIIQPGEKLHFNCHVTYTEERAALENAPSPSSIGQLGFANEAFTGEMCILFGATAGMSMGTPVTDTTPLPDFATID